MNSARNTEEPPLGGRLGRALGSRSGQSLCQNWPSFAIRSETCVQASLAHEAVGHKSLLRPLEPPCRRAVFAAARVRCQCETPTEQ